MKFEITSDLKKIRQASQRILECLNDRQVDEGFVFDVKLACEEALINAVKHGNQFQADKIVKIDCQLTEASIVIAIEDKGKGFDYKNLPDPTKRENLLKAGKRGLFLIRQAMDKVDFNLQGNKITMTKFFPGLKGGENADKTKKS